MGRRNILTILSIVLVAVVLYNVLYFTGVIGGFGQTSELEPLPPDDRFAVPGLSRGAPQPQPSVAPGPALQSTAGPARATVTLADLNFGGNWGRNPLLTPQEIWAIGNFRVVQQTVPLEAPTGLYVSAVMLDSTGRRVAVINGDVFAVGDQVSGMRIVDMGDDAVILEAGGQRHVIRIGDPEIQLSSSPRTGRY